MSKRTIERFAAVLCTLGVLCWTSVLLLMNSFAAEGMTNLTLECRTLWGNVLPNEEWNIYKVAELQDDGTCELYGDFSQYPVSFEDFSASALTKVAKTLENYAVLDAIEPYASGSSDDNGSILFSDVPDGVYLMQGKRVEQDGVLYTPIPFIISVAYEGDGETMELLAYPKYTVLSTSVDGEYSVVKKFGNKAAEPKDPKAFVTVEIYCDGNLYDTVKLNAENNWTYSWEADDYYDWRVKEIDVPSDCYVNYGREGAVLTVVNTRTKELPGEDIVTTTVTSNNVTETTTTVVTENPAETSLTQSETTSQSSTATNVTVTSNSVSEITTAVTENPSETTDTENPSETTVTETTVETSITRGKSTSKSSNTKVTTTVTTIEKLPQTGQLWWPIPILSIAGMVFLSAGLALRSRDTE